MDNKVSYYKIIDGLNFDAGLLNMADELHRPKRKMRQEYLFFIYLKTMF